MAKRGPKPKPTPLKVLNGARPCRIAGESPSPTPGRPATPLHLDGEALAEWDRIVPTLESMGVLAPADGPALAIYCVAYARWLEARKVIGEHGLFFDTTVIETSEGLEIPNPKGCIKSNPAVTVAAACEATMAKVLGSFGLTPADRSRVKAIAATGDEPRSKLDKFRVVKKA